MPQSIGKKSKRQKKTLRREGDFYAALASRGGIEIVWLWLDAWAIIESSESLMSIPWDNGGVGLE
jgi:hypothetical protein